MNFLGYPETIPDSTTIYLFKERLKEQARSMMHGKRCKGSSMKWAESQNRGHSSDRSSSSRTVSRSGTCASWHSSIALIRYLER
jgi:hypothetical protein